MRSAAQAPFRHLRASHPALALCLLLVATPALAQEDEEGMRLPVDPCADHPCRALTRDERIAFGRVLTKLMDAMPAPSRVRYQQSGLKSVQGLGQFLITDEVRQSPAFPSNVVDPMGLAYEGGTFPRSLSVAALYMLKPSERGVDLGARFHRTGSGEMEIFDVRIQATGYATAAFAEGLVTGRVFKSSGGLLVWEQKLRAEAEEEEQEADPDMVLLSVLVGERTRDRSAMRGSGDQAPDKIAPLRAIRLDLQGSRKVVNELLKRLDKKALRSLLAPAARKHGAARNKRAK